MPKDFTAKPEGFVHGGEWPRVLYKHNTTDDDLVIVYDERQKTKALRDGWSLTAADAKAKYEADAEKVKA